MPVNELRNQHIAEIEEEKSSINTQIMFKEERIKVGTQRRDFGLCESLSAEEAKGARV